MCIVSAMDQCEQKPRVKSQLLQENFAKLQNDCEGVNLADSNVFAKSK